MRNQNDDDTVNNPLKSMPFSEILELATSRRQVLKTGSALSIAGALGGPFVNRVFAETSGPIDFTPLTRSRASGSWLATSPEYEARPLLPWGDPINPSNGPAFSWPPTSAQQAQQIGVGHDGMWFFPIEPEIDEDADEDDEPPPITEGVLCINHEFGGNGVVTGKQDPETLEDVRVSQHAHGVSVVHLALDEDGNWNHVDGCNARRIHVNTPVKFSGPAADSPLLDVNGSVPLGTVNNCGSGYTPWKTYLTCEENFNLYFGATSGRIGWTANDNQERYGFSDDGGGYGWHQFDRRFDLNHAAYANEENRYGWVVEIDPFDATQTPVKRTALGRIKHEACEVVVGKDNRIVAYMGDDAQFEYIYKFVGDEDYEEVLERGESPLDLGKLYVAKFNASGSGEWLELTDENAALRSAIGELDEILTFARLAGDELGATPMDRPEWIASAPDGQIYVALTNNSSRSATGPGSPVAPNPDGHIVRWLDADDHVGLTFTWNVFKIAAETHGTEESFSDPDSIWIDPEGRLFIATDGSQETRLGRRLNNQLLVAHTGTEEIKRLFSGVRGCEVTGITPSPDQTALFVNIQHPGNGSLSVSNFPRLDEEPQIPRDATVVITRKNGGVVGS